MSGPIGPASLGDAWAQLHVRTDDVPGDVERGLEGAARDADRVLDGVGEHFGERIADSTSEELSRHGRDLGRAVERSTEREVVRPRWRFDFSRIRDRRRSARRLLDTIEEDIEDALTRGEAGGGGPFFRIGMGIRDAIGAGFNISGRSPLIPFLLPVVGVIVALVAGALQAVNALVAGIAALPALLAAVGVQAALITAAFNGVGEAIQGAFAARNAQELQEAVKGLVPQAQEFVKSLIPLRDIFKDFQRLAAANFFLNFGTDAVDDFITFLTSGEVRTGVAYLSAQLGVLFRDLALFFSNTTFREFIENVFASSVDWLRDFGPKFNVFLTGLVKLADAALPFLNQVGVIFNNVLELIGQFLIDSVVAGDSTKWLDSMSDTLATVSDLFFEIVKFVAVFLTELDKAGGQDILKEFANAFEQLTFLLASPVGEKFMKGLVAFSIAAIASFTGLVELFILLVAGVTWLVDTGIPDAIKGIGIFFGKLNEWGDKLFEIVGQAILDFFTMIGQAIMDAASAVGKWISDRWNEAVKAVADFILDMKEMITGLPGRVVEWAKGLGGALLQTGKDIISGLINGIKAMLPDLSGLFQWITDNLPDWKGPEDKDRKLLAPAGRAVMHGFAEGIQMGAMDVRRMLGDFTTDLGGIRSASDNITFGANSIQIKFSGALPTDEQATATGRAVGAGINGQLAQRNTRLAVRTL